MSTIQIRETVEAAYLMGAAGLRTLGFADVDIEEAAEDIRRRGSLSGWPSRFKVTLCLGLTDYIFGPFRSHSSRTSGQNVPRR